MPALRPRSGLRRASDGGAALRRLRPRHLGAVVVGLAAIVEITFAPPIWVHLVLWIPTILVGAIGLLRPLKAAMIALQYRHLALGGGPEAPNP